MCFIGRNMRSHGLVCALSLLSAAALSPAVEQADFWWQKSIESNVVAEATPCAPMFLPNGDMVVISPDDPGRIVITYLTPGGTVKKTVFSNGKLGAAAVDRGGKLYLASQVEGKLRLARYSVEGELESEKISPMGESPLPVSLMVERSGDLYVAGVGTTNGLGFVGQAKADGVLAWGQARGRTRAEAWKPVSMAVFQSGNVVVAGDFVKPDGTAAIRIVKVSPEGKEMTSIDLPGVPASVVSCAIDPENNVIVLGKVAGGGLVLWSLEGASGLTRWKEEKLAVPGIDPVALLIDPRKFILVLLNNTEETITRSYIVRYSMGGEAMTNFRPMEETNRGVSIAQDVNGEIYVVAKRGVERGEAVLFRLANHLLNRYMIRYTFPYPFEPQSMAVRDSDGAGVILGLTGDAAAARKPMALKFRQAPVGKHETFAVTAGQPFTSPQSVLSNDQYVDGAEMRVSQSPKRGSLEFRKDGTFTYTPAAGFKGKDTFRYQLSRGTLFWYAAIVTLDVQ